MLQEFLALPKSWSLNMYIETGQSLVSPVIDRQHPSVYHLYSADHRAPCCLWRLTNWQEQKENCQVSALS